MFKYINMYNLTVSSLI